MITTFRKLYIFGYPAGLTIGNTGSLEVTFPQIRVLSTTLGDTYMVVEEGEIKCYNQGWCKLTIPLVADA